MDICCVPYPMPLHLELRLGIMIPIALEPIALQPIALEPIALELRLGITPAMIPSIRYHACHPYSHPYAYIEISHTHMPIHLELAVCLFTWSFQYAYSLGACHPCAYSLGASRISRLPYTLTHCVCCSALTCSRLPYTLTHSLHTHSLPTHSLTPYTLTHSPCLISYQHTHSHKQTHTRSNTLILKHAGFRANRGCFRPGPVLSALCFC